MLDAFVVKLDAAGATLHYATYLGANNWDDGFAIAVDGAGQAYVTGKTDSADFPASLGPGYDTNHNGNNDAFVVKLNAAGAALRYATFLGGSGDEEGTGIAVDGNSQAYVTGYTGSANFPASLGPGYDTSYNGSDDAFVVKLDMPWASWAQGDRPLLVPPAGADAVVDYGNMTPPVPLVAQVAGAALFDTGGGGSTSINTTLPDGSGSYALRFDPGRWCHRRSGAERAGRDRPGDADEGWLDRPAGLAAADSEMTLRHPKGPRDPSGVCVTEEARICTIHPQRV